MQRAVDKTIASPHSSVIMLEENMCILSDEHGTCIFNSKEAQLNVDLLQICTGTSLANQELNLTQSLKSYNSFLKSSELVQMVQYILSSSVLTLNILKHPKEEIELNNQVLEQLERFISLVDFISIYHKNKKDFLIKWKHIFDIITLLTNFKDFDHTSTNHICVDLYPRTEEENIYVRQYQCFGSIVFIDSNSKFSFKKKEKFIGLGIICEQSCRFSDSNSSIPINFFGNSLVRVVYPSNDFVDERGMFVILNKNHEEYPGIGEIISFGDLITREANSYHLVGICSLDKTEQPNSLLLFSTPSHTSRMRHPSNDSKICFVSMISLPMSESLQCLLAKSTPLDFNKKKLAFRLL